MKHQVADGPSVLPLPTISGLPVAVMDKESILKQYEQASEEESLFAVFTRSKYSCTDSFSPGKRNYYKISLLTKGSGVMTYGGQKIETLPGSLAFINSSEAKGWHSYDGEQDGYYCIFSPGYFASTNEDLRLLSQHPLFRSGINPVLQLNTEQLKLVQAIFERLVTESQDCSPFKHDAIRLYLKLLLVEGRRMANHLNGPVQEFNAAQHLVQRFTEMMERQFPLVRVSEQVRLKTVSEFAEQLAVHSNHLNACVKKITGHTASRYISNRLLKEARLLLMHTDWHINEISWCLGFEEPASFAHFFKKNAGITANHFRQQAN